MLPAFSYADYIRDKAVIDKLSVTILDALAEVIGDEELEKLMKLKENCYTFLFWDYAEQYVYKCNIEYLKTVVEKRKDKIRNIAKRFLKQPDSYKRLKQDLEYSAKVYHCSVHELEDPKLEYPEEIEWQYLGGNLADAGLAVSMIEEGMKIMKKYKNLIIVGNGFDRWKIFQHLMKTFAFIIRITL